MNVKRLTSSDSELARAVVTAFKPPTLADRRDESALCRFLGKEENVLLACIENGSPVGFLLAYALDRLDQDRSMMLLYEIEVAAPSRRLGIGRALVDALKEISRAMGATKIWVPTNRSNLAAVNLYTATGATASDTGDEVIFEFTPSAFA